MQADHENQDAVPDDLVAPLNTILQNEDTKNFYRTYIIREDGDFSLVGLNHASMGRSVHYCTFKTQDDALQASIKRLPACSVYVRETTQAKGCAPQHTDTCIYEAPSGFAPAAEPKEPRKKASYVGAPAIFQLELLCKQLNDAFGGFGCYHVGSSLERADWRDVDVRLILSDDEFYALFPGVNRPSTGSWEHDPRWLIMTTAISKWMSDLTGLPVDFQMQPQTAANSVHKGQRSALGM